MRPRNTVVEKHLKITSTFEIFLLDCVRVALEQHVVVSYHELRVDCDFSRTDALLYILRLVLIGTSIQGSVVLLHWTNL